MPTWKSDNLSVMHFSNNLESTVIPCRICSFSSDQFSPVAQSLFPLFPCLFPMKWWDQTNHNSSYLFKFCMPHKQPNFLVSCSIFVLNSHQIFNYGHVKSFLLHLCFPESACYSAVSSRKRNCLRPSGKGLCQMFWGTSFWCHYLNNFEILSLQWARVSRTLGNELIDSWGC